jgi:hypothetical protein
MLCFTSLLCNSDTSFDQVIPLLGENWILKKALLSTFSVSLASDLKEIRQNDANDITLITLRFPASKTHPKCPKHAQTFFLISLKFNH